MTTTFPFQLFFQAILFLTWAKGKGAHFVMEDRSGSNSSYWSYIEWVPISRALGMILARTNAASKEPLPQIIFQQQGV